MNDDELLARLRAADPADRAPAPPDRWIHDLTEATMTETSTEPRARRGGWLLGAAAAVVIAGIGGYALVGRGGDGPSPIAGSEPSASATTSTELRAPGAAQGKCMVPSAEILKGADVAFAGTVASIDDDQVTLDTDLWYAGDPTDQVVVTAPSQDMVALVSAVAFEDGQRYLVAANDGVVMVCGFSAAYDEGLATLYGQAFPG
ncbi:hypothetical protein [Nocardioides sp.]|uniref:hypothetical protein n=1 Tax=Nocardioides sp. TaxID=35761 RepID=UPI003D128130